MTRTSIHSNWRPRATMGNPKKQGMSQGTSGKTPSTKLSSLTRYFKDSTDHKAEATESKMAVAKIQTESSPSSPTPSEGSHKSQDKTRDN
ncbi:Hypothetical predicted protein [Pelobates cultripes]|uniref:Uncharacterized protein n=1 Tax=Pelobates cultripes TaxID=61616 RepID=A0AAD1SFT6_PELCU|nr:Hypothetical predicted protein [Pelobates cultripes]